MVKLGVRCAQRSVQMKTTDVDKNQSCITQSIAIIVDWIPVRLSRAFSPDGIFSTLWWNQDTKKWLWIIHVGRIWRRVGIDLFRFVFNGRTQRLGISILFISMSMDWGAMMFWRTKKGKENTIKCYSWAVCCLLNDQKRWKITSTGSRKKTKKNILSFSSIFFSHFHFRRNDRRHDRYSICAAISIFSFILSEKKMAHRRFICYTFRWLGQNRGLKGAFSMVDAAVVDFICNAINANRSDLFMRDNAFRGLLKPAKRFTTAPPN